jgi:aspartate/methionine/tyrosine aminotransferase
MVTSFVIVAVLALVGGFVKVPYVSLGPGPTYNTLGSVGGQVVVEVDGTKTYPTSGQLRMTTVSINDEVTLFDALGKWVSGRYALAPRDEYFSPGQTQEDLERENTKMFQDSQSGLVHNLKLTEENNFLPDLDDIPAEVLEKAKVLVINYPNNPTGASATAEFYAKVVAFAKKNEIIVISDAAYAALVFDGKPMSFLATPGAKEVGIELHSTSKSFNMTGWRCGFVAGNELLVKAYGDMKDNTDSGQFLAIQHASAYCFDHPEITEKIAAKYSRRMDGLVQVLKNAGFNAKKPRGSFFLYAKAPKAVVQKNGERTELKTAEDATQWLLSKKLISTVPWDDVGAYLRFSVTFLAKNEADEQRVLKEMANRLGDVKFEF